MIFPPDSSPPPSSTSEPLLPYPTWIAGQPRLEFAFDIGREACRRGSQRTENRFRGRARIDVRQAQAWAAGWDHEHSVLDSAHKRA